MKFPPIDKRALVHSIKWIPKKIQIKDEQESFIINKVRLSENITLTFHKHQVQESNIGNWRLWWDIKNSDALPEGKTFSIGDTIEFMPNSPIYPYVTQVHNIIPAFDADGTIHHLELVLL